MIISMCSVGFLKTAEMRRLNGEGKWSIGTIDRRRWCTAGLPL